MQQLMPLLTQEVFIELKKGKTSMNGVGEVPKVPESFTLELEADDSICDATLFQRDFTIT